MPQVLIRDIDPDVYDRLKKRASRNHRTFAGELRHILAEADRLDITSIDMEAKMQEIRDMFKGRVFSDSAELIREDRDR